MDSLVVDLNRSGPHSVEVAPAFHTDGSFEVVLDNHAAALHVFLQLDDDLAEAATLSAGNHFVDAESIRRVGVDVDGANAPARGRLKVVTGYGSETAFVTVTVEEREEEATGVEVDESLGRPRPRPEPEPSDGLSFDPQNIPVLVLGGLAVLVALLAATTLGGDVALLAVLVVLLAAGVGAVLLRG